MTTELVSIIIPVYNKEDYLAACIESVIDQTHDNLEIILIDDGSTDNSLKICRKYEKEDKRIHTYTQENSGVSHARNKGLSVANGDYISFIDADDYIKENFISQLISTMNFNQVDVVYCNYLQDYNGEYLKRKSRIAPGKYNTNDLYPIMIDDGTVTGMLFGSACTALYKKDIITDNNILFETELTHNEDGVFNLEVLLVSRELFFLGNKYLYINRRIDDSATQSIVDDSRFEDATDKIIELCKRYEVNLENSPQLKRRNVSIAFWKIISYSDNKEIKVRDAVNKIYSILNDTELEASYIHLNLKKINKPKRLLSFLMRKKKVKLLYYLINKLYPLLSSIYRR